MSSSYHSSCALSLELCLSGVCSDILVDLLYTYHIGHPVSLELPEELPSVEIHYAWLNTGRISILHLFSDELRQQVESDLVEAEQNEHP